MRFGQPNQHDQPESRRLKPPPNYSSRRVQLRLLVLVSMFMLIVVMMDKVRDPQMWMWMGFKDTPPPRPADSIDVPQSSTGDSRPRANGSDRRAFPASFYEPFGGANPDDYERSVLDGWRRALDGLTDQQQTELRRFLLSARGHLALAPEQLAQLADAIDRLDASWQSYLENARRTIDQQAEEMSKPQRRAWLEVVQRLERHWTDGIKSALEQPFQDVELGDNQRGRLSQLQSILDALDLKAVRDNTLLRSVEKDSWFRIFESLSMVDPAALRTKSLGHVNFLQLFRQPGQYRGSLVTIRGTARLAYHVQAPKNMYGIGGYYIFWLKPAAGPNSPVVVYSLETPPGFPAIKDKDLDRETTELDEDVEFTGYFYKRYVYRAREGTNTAPLILARVPDWSPAPASRLAVRPLPNRFALATYILGAAAIGIVIALVAYQRSRWVSTASLRVNRYASRDPHGFRQMADKELGPTVAESLEKIAKSEDGE